MTARPTYRAVILVGSLVPLSLVLILIDETLWPVTIAALGAVLFLIAADWRLGAPFAASMTGLIADKVPGRFLSYWWRTCSSWPEWNSITNHRFSRLLSSSLTKLG